jgi:hypothetical protein
MGRFYAQKMRSDGLMVSLLSSVRLSRTTQKIGTGGYNSETV